MVTIGLFLDRHRRDRERSIQLSSIGIARQSPKSGDFGSLSSYFFFSWEVWDFGYSWQDLPTSLSVKWKGRSPISTRTTAHVATSTEQTKGPWSLALARALLIACRPAALSLAGCCNFFLFYFVPERNSSKEGFLLEVRLFNSLDPKIFSQKCHIKRLDTYIKY